MFPIEMWIKYTTILAFGIIVLVFLIFCYKMHKTNLQSGFIADNAKIKAQGIKSLSLLLCRNKC